MFVNSRFSEAFPGIVCVGSTARVQRWARRDGSPITVAELKAIEQFLSIREELPAGSLPRVRGVARVVYAGAVSRFAALEMPGRPTVTCTVTPKKHLPPAAAKPSRGSSSRMDVEARPRSMDALADRLATLLHPRVAELRRERN